MKVFVAGSRAMRTLNEDIQDRLSSIFASKLQCLWGMQEELIC